MLKYPSVQASVGEGARIIISEDRDNENAAAKANKFSNLFGQRGLLQSRQVLKLREFMCIAFFSQVTLTYITIYINLALKWGSGAVTIFFPIVSVVSGVPLSMTNLFLGHYSKCGYIKFWECTPIFKGFSFSVAMLMISNAFYDIAIGGLTLNYILSILSSSVPWRTCDFKKATKFCYDGNKIMKNNFTQNNGTTQNLLSLNCCLQFDKECLAKNPYSYLNFSTYEYFRCNKLGFSRIPIDWNGHVDFNMNLIAIVGFIWVLLLLLMIQGVPRFRGIMFFFWIIIGILTIPILLFSIYTSPKYASNEVVNSDFSQIYNPLFWLELIFYSISKELPANFVILGKQTPPSFSPFVDALCIYSLKFLTLTITILWMSIGVTKIHVHYGLEDIKCIHVMGVDFFFVVVPHMLMLWPPPHLWLLLWFFMLLIFSIFSPLITMVSCVDSLTDAFPIMARNRTRLCFIFAFVCFLANCVVLNQYFLDLLLTWVVKGGGIITAVSLLVFVAAMFFYSVQRLAHDFYFTYGKPINKSLFYGLKLAFLITWIVCWLYSIRFIFHPTSYDKIESYFLRHLIHGLMGLNLLPAIIILFYIYSKHLKQTGGRALIVPSAAWGPTDDIKKQARLQFDPQREVRCRSRGQRCKHNCLLNSTKLKAEILRLRKAQEIILKSV